MYLQWFIRVESSLGFDLASEVVVKLMCAVYGRFIGIIDSI